MRFHTAGAALLQTAYVALLLLHYLAVLGLLCFWAFMLDALRWPAPGDQALRLRERIASSPRPSGGPAPDSNIDLAEPLLAQEQPTANRPGYPCAFYLPRLLVVMGMWAALVVTYLLGFEPPVRVHGEACALDDDASALANLYLVFSICVTCWIVYVLFGFNRAYTRLRQLPYLETRDRQLSFHFFTFHASWVIAWMIGRYLWDTWRSPSPLVQCGNFDPDSSCLLCSVYLWLLAFVYAPPPRGATRGSTGGGKGKPLDVNKVQLLLEAACVAYAESAVPGSVSTGSGDAVDSWGSLDDLGLEQDAFIHDPATDTTVLVASEGAAEARRRGRRRRLVVAFRGTRSRRNALTDAKFLSTAIDLTSTDQQSDAGLASSGASGDAPDLWEQIGSPDTGGAGRRCGGYGGCFCVCCRSCFSLSHWLQPRVHGGFWAAYRSVSPQLRQAVRDSVSRMQAEEPGAGLELLLTGHSLGGALAQICALDLGGTLFPQRRSWRERLSSVLKGSGRAHPDAVALGVCTFGSPRVGNHRFGSLLTQAVESGEAWRIVCDRDFVVNLNKGCLGYAHAGREIIVDGLGNCIVSPSVVERAFRPTRNAFADHYLTAYLTAIEALRERHSGGTDRPDAGSTSREEPARVSSEEASDVGSLLAQRNAQQLDMSLDVSLDVPEGADGTEPDAHLLFTDSPVRGARGSRTAGAAGAAAGRSSGNEAAQSVLDLSVDAPIAGLE